MESYKQLMQTAAPSGGPMADLCSRAEALAGHAEEIAARVETAVVALLGPNGSEPNVKRDQAPTPTPPYVLHKLDNFFDRITHALRGIDDSISRL